MDIKNNLTPVHVHVCTTGLICGETPFNHNVHNERVIGGHDAERNVWKWQVKPICTTYRFNIELPSSSYWMICRITVHLCVSVFSQVSLQHDAYNDGYFYHICGGTLISQFHIMTAAHCILRLGLSLIPIGINIHLLFVLVNM